MTQPQSLIDLLSGKEDQVSETETTICESCGADVELDVEICPECNGRVELLTIADIGKQLPIGVESGGVLEKSFDLEPLGWEKKKNIGRDWNAIRNKLTAGNYIGTILANAVTKIASYEINSKMSLDRKLDIFNQMYAADIFYMYAYLRLISNGKDLILKNLRCPTDDHSFTYTADVSTLGVVCFDSIKQLEHKIKLDHGFDMGGSHRDTIIIQPAKWNMMNETPSSSYSEIEMFGSMLINSVVEVVGLDRGAMMTELQLKQLDGTDLEICREGMDRVLGGPKWFVEGECTVCQEPFFFELDWTYENFFARSYTSQRRRKRSRKQRR
jgi:hypothetical protein